MQALISYDIIGRLCSLSEKAMAPHSSTLAWKIPWMEEHGGLQSMGWRLSDFTFTFHFHALEKEMATHSSVLAWRIPGTGEPGGLPPMGSHRVGHDWSDLTAAAACNPSQNFYSLSLYLSADEQWSPFQFPKTSNMLILVLCEQNTRLKSYYQYIRVRL